MRLQEQKQSKIAFLGPTASYSHQVSFYFHLLAAQIQLDCIRLHCNTFVVLSMSSPLKEL